VPEAERHDILDAVAALPKDVTVAADRARHGHRVLLRDDRISVLVNGTLFVEGPPDEVAADPRVKAVLSRRGSPWLNSFAIDRLTAGYGEAVVLAQISVAVPEGQSLALLGRNGMGKTTLVNSSSA